jgi:hypothetical protein
MTMIERIARALCISQGENPDQPTPHHKTVDFIWQHYRKDARAVLEAMMEPTDQMVKAAFDVFASENDAKANWYCMIEAALKEGGG